MMRYNRLVWEFMIQVIGEKYRNQDFSGTEKDLSALFTRLQAQDDSVSSWSEATINKIKEDIDKYVEAIREKLMKTLESCDGVQIN